MNRGVRRARLFDSDGDYQTCLIVLAAAFLRHPAQLLAYCLMPNHFHLVVRPTEDKQLSRLMHWFTGTHSRRWHLQRETTGTGSVYQGRFKAFPIQADGHFLTVCRYVERNPLRAGLVRRVEDWPWSSLSDRSRGLQMLRLSPWPVDRPSDWLDHLNRSDNSADVERVRTALVQSVPFGTAEWSERVGNTLGIQPSVRAYRKISS
jgi:putative transposase